MVLASPQAMRCALGQDGASRRMDENGFAPPPPRKFCRHILSCRELKAESFKRCFALCAPGR